MEFLSTRRTFRNSVAVWNTLTTIGRRIEITSAASRLAAAWLAPMDRVQRRARFADAVIAAVSSVEEAVLVTSDPAIGATFPVPVFEY